MSQSQFLYVAWLLGPKNALEDINLWNAKKYAELGLGHRIN